MAFSFCLASWRIGGAFFLFGVLILSGCQQAHVAQPLTRTLADNDPHVRSEFWYQLADCPVTSNDDAFHGLLIYLDGTDRNVDYAGRVADLRSRKMLPANFDAAADEPVTRGTLAVALVKALNIQGGLTMRLFGPQPRYALRALEYRGVFERCSPNQSLSGGEFVGVMQKAEEFTSGNPADLPATKMPVQPAEGVAFFVPDIEQENLNDAGIHPLVPLYFDDTPTTSTATTNTPTHLHVLVTGVQGDTAEVRKSNSDTWQRAKIGMVLSENAEFRTGAKSAIRFIIPPDQTFSLDSQGATTVEQAVLDRKKMTTRVALAHGRVREDLVPIPPGTTTQPVEVIRIEQAGLEHDTVIESPNTALALRGTKVSLFDQQSFTPEAVSLTGRAFYTNTRGVRVPFGGTSLTHIRGAQTSAVQQADSRSSTPQSEYLGRTDFEIQELSIVSQRGGFVRGDVIVGDLRESDFPRFPGSLDFVLTWSGGPQHQLNDLNLGVFSPLNTSATPDFVANPPFLVSLHPNSPSARKERATNYPLTSKSGGRISQNSVGPDGLEVAYWGKNYPIGDYRVIVFNLLDKVPPPAATINPISYTVDEFINGTKELSFTGSVGFLQTSPAITFLAAPVATPGALVRKPAITGWRAR
jgi:hypothetical protein